jgi:hypothetical protein
MTDLSERYREKAERRRDLALLGEEREAITSEDMPVSASGIEHGATGWPRPLAAPAYHGLAGEIVKAMDPVTEADPAAILFSLLVGYGSAVGPSAFFRTEGDRQTANLFAVLVGNTASGRKGTSWGRVHRLLAIADPGWETERIVTGLSSGEGLIWAVRDPIERQEPVKEKGRVVRYETVIADQGVTDKRLLAYQSEFASTLRVLQRDGNTLSPIMREAWDRGDLGLLTKNSPARATGAHISLLGHISKPELLRYFDSTEAANGWGNRILWPCVRRSKLLPEGGRLDERVSSKLGAQLQETLIFGRSVTEIIRTDDARNLWAKEYSGLTEERSGLLGAVTARGAAQVCRLSVIYALLDRSLAISELHLRAALAVWDYAEDSARYIFGESLGDPTADRILGALRAAGLDGLTRTEIGSLFGKHASARQTDRALETLVSLRFAEERKEATRGRPVERWVAL